MKRPSSIDSRKGASRFEYRAPKKEKLQERAEQQGGAFDSIVKSNITLYKSKEGENIVRILPPTWDNHEHYGYDIYVHFNVGGDKSAYLCLEKNKGSPGGPCPVCVAMRAAKADRDEEAAKEFSPKRRVACWVLDRSSDEDASSPKFWSMPWTMDRDISALCHSKRTGEVLLIDHPDDGYDFSFRQKGKGKTTDHFGHAIDRDPCPIHDDQKKQDEILEFLVDHPIPSVLKFYNAGYIDRVLNGETSTQDEDPADQEPERPARTRTREPDPDEGEGEQPRRDRPTRTRQAEAEDSDDEPAPRRDERPPRRAAEVYHDDENELESERPAVRRPRTPPAEPQDPDEEPKQSRASTSSRRAPSRQEDEENDPPYEEDRQSVRRPAPTTERSRRAPPPQEDEYSEENEEHEPVGRGPARTGPKPGRETPSRGRARD